MKVVELIKRQSKQWVCVLYIDNIADIDPTADIEGLPKSITLSAGSIVYDSSLNIAVLNSNLEWVTSNE